MATRMQQRRGTAAQWTAANPVLAAGEIGFETDTSKFKMGNGSSAWTALTYFANAAELAAIIDGAPDLLNTLNELAAAVGDDPTFFTSVATNLSSHEADTTSVHGIANTALLATTAGVNTVATNADAALTAHGADTTSVHGIADTSLLATTANVSTAKSEAISDAAAAADTKVSTHSSDTTSVHGIADTSALATTADTSTAISTAVSTHNTDTTEVHGISNTANLVYTATVTEHTGATTNVHGISNTALIALLSDLTAHANDTTSIHGIADTTQLATLNDIATATVDQSALAGTGIDWNSVNERFDIDSTIATKVYADGAVTTHQADTTNVHGISDTSLLATTADVAAVTKTTLGLGNVDNTADASKPVSTAQSSAIATAKAEAIADATSQVNALLTGAPAALNTLDELAAALGDDANFAASVTTSLGLKVDSLTPISQKTASYTLSSLTERDDLIEMGSGSALTLTIPTDATLNFPIGTSIDILQTGAGQVTIAPVSGTVTVNATPGLKLRTTWSSATLFKRAANTWVVFGDLTA